MGARRTMAATDFDNTPPLSPTTPSKNNLSATYLADATYGKKSSKAVVRVAGLTHTHTPLNESAAVFSVNDKCDEKVFFSVSFCSLEREKQFLLLIFLFSSMWSVGSVFAME